ncbi:MAG: metal ABC transporter permease [Candidatus Marinimicrobia bacterium]|nr:metal ABC transporter permease [Candidatus Neomarinimicrobiota bacterium]
MIELLEYDFIRNAVYIGILASILCGVLGTFIVVKRLVFISGGVSHAAFGGIGAFYYWGLNPLAGGFLVAGILAIVLGLTNRDKLINQGALIGVLWALGMAIGILFIARAPGYTPNLMTYMFGNILAVSVPDLVFAALLDLIVIGIIIVFYKEFVAISFDEEFAFIQGVPVRILMVIFMLLVSISIVLLIRLVGVILVIALLTIPPMISLMLVKRFLMVILLSMLVGMIMTIGGLCFSYLLDLPSGPVIITVGAAVLGLSYISKIILMKLNT